MVDDPMLFAGYANGDFVIWQSIVGEFVFHKSFGVGIIEGVGGIANPFYIDICFDNDEKET